MPGCGAKFSADLMSVVPDVRLVGVGAYEVELASGRWQVRAMPSVLRLEHDGLAVDWEAFHQIVTGTLGAYLDAFGPLRLETAVLGCTLSLSLPLEPQTLGRIFRVYPVLTHPLAAGVEGFRLAATFQGPRPEESFRVYLASQPGPDPDRLGVIFELEYCRHFLRPPASGEVADWLNIAPAVFKELLGISLPGWGGADL